MPVSNFVLSSSAVGCSNTFLLYISYDLYPVYYACDGGTAV